MLSQPSAKIDSRRGRIEMTQPWVCPLLSSRRKKEREEKEKALANRKPSW
jgi:hypothetical protein